MSFPSAKNFNGYHRRNNSTSFESFTASCDDAWDSKIEDCIGSLEELGVANKDANRKIDGTVNSTRKISTQSEGAAIERENRTSKSAPGTASLVRPSVQSHQQSTPSSSSSSFSSSSSKDTSRVSLESASGGTACTNVHLQGAKGSAANVSDPKLAKFNKLINEDEVCDLNQLRTMAWAGIPSEVRPLTWKLLLGYLPVYRSRRPGVEERKRVEYGNLVQLHYNNRATNDEMWRQIHIDIPRMQPLISIFQQELVQRMFERILFIWSVRHPASGYVQGMNDLVTPFFVTYLSEFIPSHSLADVESFPVSTLSDAILRGVEADTFWSFSKLLDSIQDNYVFAQPGIQRLVNLLSRVMSRVDPKLHDHLNRNSVQYLQFAFRWMNNLLIRELPLKCIVRLWDTYLAEGVVASSVPQLMSDRSEQNNEVYDMNPWTIGNETPFSSSFHLFVCAAFLRYWSKNLLREQDFQGLMLLLQNLPTFHWGDNEIKIMVADAYQLKYSFTPNHLNSS